MDRDAPFISNDLIDWLKSIYPNELPAEAPDLLVITRAIGRQDVIRRLVKERDRQ